GQVRQGALLLLLLGLEGLIGVGVDLLLLATGFDPQPLDGPLPDLLADAGQIGGVEAFPAQEFADGLITGLGFQINLELLLGGKKPPLLFGALLGCFGWIATAHVFASILSRQGWGMVPVALRAPSTIPHP